MTLGGLIKAKKTQNDNIEANFPASPQSSPNTNLNNISPKIITMPTGIIAIKANDFVVF